VDDENYLIPTDITLRSPTDLDLNAISVSLLLKQMKRDDRVNIVILDACRDNPFAASLARARTRALVVERGLTRIDGDLARGTLIAFASDPKSTALDGPTGQHSPFTQAFLAHLFDAGVTIDTVMSRVRNDVWEKTGHHQLPWVNTSLIGEYELNPQPAAEPAADNAKPSETVPPAGQRQAEENLLWESAQHSNLAADYQAYLNAFPSGVFAQMAKNRIASMESARTSAPTPAPETLAMTEPSGPKDDALKDNAGTADTERTLNLGAAGEKEVQQRLSAIDLYNGPKTGALDTATRSALAQWQKKSGFAPTSFLDSTQLAALRADSETEYQKSLAAQPAIQPVAPEAPRRALARPSPKPPVVREAKPSAPATPARRVVKRTKNPNRYETADQAAPPPPPPVFLGGSPAWRRRAGLPELPTDPGLGGRPPGFWLGSSGGLMLGGH
jgi:hypothetical protein